MSKTNMFEKSIIVSAHPDDEILWFSSIIDKVDKVLVCFLAIESDPDATINRQKCLKEYPLKNIDCLGLDESEAFDVDWKKPSITKYGMEIVNKEISRNKYKNNYFTLRKYMENILIDYRNVFTHNLWGEYGHIEHVQVYRVIKELQKKMKFNVWFPNYCSNKSINLMITFSAGMGSEYTTLKTNQALANSIMDLYIQNSCWTWFNNWKWSAEESFIKDECYQDEYLKLTNKSSMSNTTFNVNLKENHHAFPLIFIKVKLLSTTDAKPALLRIIPKKIRKIVKYLMKIVNIKYLMLSG
jgi:hypothetical protein